MKKRRMLSLILACAYGDAMRKKLLTCILCVMLVLVSGCHSREESSISEEDMEAGTSSVSSDTAAEHTDDGNGQSESSASQAREPSEGITSSQVVPYEPLSPNKNRTENAQEYQTMERNAEALEKYLRDNLSPDDYGGIYLEKWGLGNDGGIFLYVWTMDESALDSIIAAYTGDPFPVERLNARCSLTQLQQLNAALNDIKVGEDAYISHALSETGNLVTITISDSDFESISNEIEQITNNLDIPDECVIIREVLPENPVT